MSDGALVVLVLLALLVVMLAGLFAVFLQCFEPTVIDKPIDDERPPPYDEAVA